MPVAAHFQAASAKYHHVSSTLAELSHSARMARCGILISSDYDTGRLPGIEGPTAPIWEWLAQLNATRFAGQSDWRIPSVEEVTAIVDYAVFDPAVDRIFDGGNCGRECTDLNSASCSCTQSCRSSAIRLDHLRRQPGGAPSAGPGARRRPKRDHGQLLLAVPSSN
jgi:hypothetical protein